MNLQGKVALITGASSGIGEALSREFAKRGAHVVLLARRAERIEKLHREIESPFYQVLSIVGDVNREEDLKRAVQEILGKWGRLDFVIANAGFGVVGSFEQLSTADFRRQFETNVFGVINTLQATFAEVKKTRGSFGIVGSVNGFLALPGNSPYSMSKFAVRALADAVRAEWHPAVSVTHVAPGFVASEIRSVDNQGHLQADSRDPIPRWIVMPAAKAARQIVSAVVKRKSEIVVTGHGKFAVFLARHFPRFVRWAITFFKVGARKEPISQGSHQISG